MKRIFFDIDYTLYDGYLGTNFNVFMAKHRFVSHGILDQEKQLLDDFSGGKVDYREAAYRALQLHARCLKGKSTKEVEGIQLKFEKDDIRIFDWAYAAINFLKAQNSVVYLISAAPVTAVRAVAKSLNVDTYYGTELEVHDGRYTGKLKTVLNYEEKHRLIQRLVSRSQGDVHIGFGDSMGDVDMLSAMDKAFLYEPKSEELIQIAKDNGWMIVTRDTVSEYVKAL